MCFDFIILFHMLTFASDVNFAVFFFSFRDLVSPRSFSFPVTAEAYSCFFNYNLQSCRTCSTVISDSWQEQIGAFLVFSLLYWRLFRLQWAFLSVIICSCLCWCCQLSVCLLLGPFFFVVSLFEFLEWVEDTDFLADSTTM